MSALDDLFDGHYFTEDPHVYIPIDEAQQELVDLRTRIAELEKAVEEAEEVIEEYVTQEGATASAELWRLKKYGKEQK